MSRGQISNSRGKSDMNQRWGHADPDDDEDFGDHWKSYKKKPAPKYDRFVENLTLYLTYNIKSLL